MSVTGIGGVGNSGGLTLAKPAAEIARQHAGKGHWGNHFLTNKVFDIFVGGTTE